MTLIHIFPVSEKFYVIVDPSTGRGEVLDTKNSKMFFLDRGT